MRLPGRAVVQAERLDRADGRGLERRGVRAVAPEQQQPGPRNEIREAPERQPDLVEVRVDVGVIELDVVDDGDVGQVLQELGRLVEERAVVLVAFDDEMPPADPTR